MDNTANIEILGFIAAVLTTAAFLPQVYKTWRTKDVSGLSLPMFLMFFTGITLWFIYGFLINSPSLIFANGITMVSTFLLLFFIVKYRKK
ncbi:SemiSWEET family sugar transporter [Geojedonia litorea]|uniref:SemiSWEET family sugar transporter n=1 Tax=Geojedonia litorea TaxID=1268269 RepID=A0ABV9N5Q8_9FLAO